MMRFLAGMMCLVLLVEISLGATRGDKAKYVGGTLTAVAENTEIELDLNAEAAATLTWKKHKKNTAGRMEVPYKGIESIEYGQKVGRRVGVAIAVSPLALFSKKKKHYVTLTFVTPEGKKEGVVLELAKGIVRKTLTALETRSGKPVEYESEEARKSIP